MASIIRQLSDADLEAVHHMLRRKDRTQLEVAQEVEQRLGEPIAKSDPAKQRLISRYANSPDYLCWLAAYENREADLQKSIALQKERYDLVRDLVSDRDNSGIEAISNGLKARLLTMAAEMSDENLMLFASGKGFVKNVMEIVQKDLRDVYKKRVEDLKAQLSTLADKNKSGKLLPINDVIDRVDAIMGLK